MRLRVCAALLLCALFTIFSTAEVQASAIPLGENVQITDAGLLDRASDVKLAARGDSVFAVWMVGGGSSGSVYFAKSNNGGQSWGSNLRISTGSCDYWPTTPSIAVDSEGVIWVVWYLFYSGSGQRSNHICMARSDDGGDTFATGIVLRGDGLSDLYRPRIAADPDSDGLYMLIHLASESVNGYDLVLLTRDPETEEWSPTLVSDVAGAGRVHSGTDSGPLVDLVVNEDAICAAWEDQRERFSIHGACSTDGGATFGSNFRISESDAVFPRIAFGPDGALFAAYSISDDSNTNVRIRRSDDLGESWSETRFATNLSATAQRAHEWDLAVDENGVLVLGWTQRVGSNSRVMNISTSLDDGENWSVGVAHDDSGRFPTTATRVGVSVVTVTGTDGSRAYLAWEDTRNSSPRQIWSARFGLNAEPPTAPESLSATPGATSVLLDWAESTHELGIQGYRIFRATSDQGPWTELNPLLVSGTQYRDVELDGTTYFYRVAAVNTVGATGPFSGIASAGAHSDATPGPEGLLAYQRDNLIRVRTLASGAEIELGEGRNPQFSADGTRVYRIQGLAIGWQPVEGGSVTQFFSDAENRGLAGFAIAPNDTHLATLVGDVKAFCVAVEPIFGTPDSVIFHDQNRIAADIALSPDRTWMVYRNTGACSGAGLVTFSPHDLCTIYLETGERNCLDSVGYVNPAFSPDGAWLAFGARYTGQYEIWKARFLPDGSLANLVQLTRGLAGQESRAPRWSSDGNWIVFQRDIDPGEDEDLRLFAVQADGQGLVSLGIAGENPAIWGGGSVDDPDDPEPTVRTLYIPDIYRP